MSSPLAIAAVTAALKDLLNNGLLDHDLSSIGSFAVTALPPDRIITGATEANQLNLFLYQVTPNMGWRNADLPGVDSRGARVSSPPLALDLHYFLSAYGAQDLAAEVLLGYAMHLLHETPILTRDRLRVSLGGVSPVDGTLLPSPFGSLSAADLADQIEQVKITPVFLPTEEVSKMWTALQARYRPTMAYMVSVVLIQSTAGARIAPPVLARGQDDRGPEALAAAAPTLSSVRPAASELLPAMRLGDDLIIVGANLASANGATVLLENGRQEIVRELAPLGASASELKFHLPSVAEDPAVLADWAAGLYTVSVRVNRPGAWVTNGVPIALAPRITVTPTAAAAGDLTLTVTCAPRLRPVQERQVSLLFGGRQITPDSVSTPADPLQPSTLTFSLPAVAAGEYLVRLRVEGIDSLPIVLAGSPAKFTFDPQQKVRVT